MRELTRQLAEAFPSGAHQSGFPRETEASQPGSSRSVGPSDFLQGWRQSPGNLTKEDQASAPTALGQAGQEGVTESQGYSQGGLLGRSCGLWKRNKATACRCPPPPAPTSPPLGTSTQWAAGDKEPGPGHSPVGSE